LTILAKNARAESPFPAWVDQAYLVHHMELMHRLHAMIIPNVAWKNVPFLDAIDDLAAKSRAADPTHQGIHFTVPLGALHHRGIGFPVSFKGENVPFLTLLKKLDDYYSYEVTDEGVKFVDRHWCETIAIPTFYVTIGFFQLHAEDAIPEEPGVYDVSSQLLALGVSDSRTTATYSPRFQRLKVVISSPRAWEEVDEALYR